MGSLTHYSIAAFCTYQAPLRASFNSFFVPLHALSMCHSKYIGKFIAPLRAHLYYRKYFSIPLHEIGNIL